jgi:hypothetical protein
MIERRTSMVKNETSEVQRVDGVGAHVDAATQSLRERGQAVAIQLPEAVDGVSGLIEAATAQLDDLSDQGVVAAVALAAGVMIGLLLAGTPRPILALALLPIAITGRAALQRGVRPSRLIARAGGPRAD